MTEDLNPLALCKAHGLNDKAFWRIHHKRLVGKHETIASFSDWVKDRKIHENGTNQRVLERCKWMLKVCDSLGEQPDWVTLAEAAWFAVPHQR